MLFRSSVTTSEEDIVANLLSTPFSRLTLNEKLELFGKGRPTPVLNLVQKKAFESHLMILLDDEINQGAKALLLGL